MHITIRIAIELTGGEDSKNVQVTVVKDEHKESEQHTPAAGTQSEPNKQTNERWSKSAWRIWHQKQARRRDRAWRAEHPQQHKWHTKVYDRSYYKQHHIIAESNHYSGTKHNGPTDCNDESLDDKFSTMEKQPVHLGSVEQQPEITETAENNHSNISDNGLITGNDESCNDKLSTRGHDSKNDIAIAHIEQPREEGGHDEETPEKKEVQLEPSYAMQWCPECEQVQHHDRITQLWECTTCEKASNSHWFCEGCRSTLCHECYLHEIKKNEMKTETKAHRCLQDV